MNETQKDRCTTVRLDAADLERSVSQPALARLLLEGWTIAASFAGEEGSPPRQWIYLILAPPRPVVVPPVPVSVPSDRAGTIAPIAAIVVAVAAIVVAALAVIGG